jgi:hypothetical protein
LSAALALAAFAFSAAILMFASSADVSISEVSEESPAAGAAGPPVVPPPCDETTPTPPVLPLMFEPAPLGCEALDEFAFELRADVFEV